MRSLFICKVTSPYNRNTLDRPLTHLVCLVLIAFLPSCSSGMRSSVDLDKADKLAKQHDVTSTRHAVGIYMKHMEQRLSDRKRPSEENPNFYYLLIGDAYLGIGDLERAWVSYSEAQKKGVDTALLAMRYRDIARALSKLSMLGKDRATDLLDKYRELDQLMYDLDKDEYHKAMLVEEDMNSDDKHPRRTQLTDAYIEKPTVFRIEIVRRTH